MLSLLQNKKKRKLYLQRARRVFIVNLQQQALSWWRWWRRNSRIANLAKVRRKLRSNPFNACKLYGIPLRSEKLGAGFLSRFHRPVRQENRQKRSQSVGYKERAYR